MVEGVTTAVLIQSIIESKHVVVAAFDSTKLCIAITVKCDIPPSTDTSDYFHTF